MKLVEVSQLPEVCLKCPYAQNGKEQELAEDAYCYNCDYALERWRIIEDDIESDNLKDNT